MSGGPPSLIVISGCSGSGKSTLLKALAGRGYVTRPEAGRQIVKQEMASGGDGLPWENFDRFVDLTAHLGAKHVRAIHPSDGPVFFDRSVVDVVSSFERRGLPTPAPLAAILAQTRYNETVFLSPPWPEIFVNDGERRHSFEEAAAEYDWLVTAYAKQGYRPVEIAITPTDKRADFLLQALNLPLSRAQQNQHE